MSTQLLFYTDAVPVSSQRHADLCVKAGGDFGFARGVNSVPVTAVEFRAAAPEYVLVFAGRDDGIMPVAILGAEAEHNAFVDAEGKWSGRYIPAFVRRYPFVFAASEDGRTFTLCIDEGFAGANREGRGERLFDADGARTGYLNGVLEFVKDYQAQFQRTRALCARLKELDLLEAMQATFTLPGGERRNLTGFMAVSRAKLKALGDAELAQMARSDELELIHLHLASLGNFQHLVADLGAAAQGPAAAAGDAVADAEAGEGAPAA